MKEENEDHHRAATAFVKRMQETATERGPKRAPRAPASPTTSGITINRPTRCTIVIGTLPRARNNKP